MIVIEGDCLRVMAAMPTASIDLVVTDPPYEIVDMSVYFAEMLPDEDQAQDAARLALHEQP
jgi:DNA modification methylase